MDSQKMMLGFANHQLRKIQPIMLSAALPFVFNIGYAANGTDAKKYGVNAIVMHNTTQQTVRVHAKMIQMQNVGGEILIHNRQAHSSLKNLTDKNLQKINNIASAVFKTSKLENYWSDQGMSLDIQPASQGKMITWTREYNKANKLQIVITNLISQDTVVVECQQQHSKTSKWSCNLPSNPGHNNSTHFHTSVDKNNEQFSVDVSRNSTFLHRNNQKTYNFNSPKIIFFTWYPFNPYNTQFQSVGASSHGAVLPTAPPPYVQKFS